MERRLLIIEDDPGLQRQMKWCFPDIRVALAESREDAMAALRKTDPQVVTLDLGLPPEPGGSREGFALLREILETRPQTRVVVITGREERENAARAIGMGACDFYQKPLDSDTLTFVVNRAFRLLELEEENRRLSELARDDHSPLDGIIATSQEMLDVCEQVKKIAGADITTLVLGETGTGKEIIARSVHNLSTRRDKPFIAINCAAIPENLLESELFGYEKGAFTGANSRKAGKIEMADGGSLFLDEIGDMPLSLQSKLLRFLQERCVERVGGHAQVPVDVRVICATHRNLGRMITDGSFREDLYYRISEIEITIPALRDRPGDAIALAQVFVKRFSAQQGKSAQGLTDDAAEAITRHRWPGNVREMENRIKRAVLMSKGPWINASDLQLSEKCQGGKPEALNLREIRDKAESRAIVQALLLTGNNVARAARTLGVTRPTLYSLMDKYHLKEH